MFLFNFIILFISLFGFVFFMIILNESILIELILKVIFLVLWLSSIVLKRLNVIKNQLIFRLISYSMSISLLVISFGEIFFFTKVILYVFYCLSYQSFTNSWNVLSYRAHKRIGFLHHKLVALTLIGSMLTSVIILFAVPTYVQIKAKNDPEIIFWTDPYSCPKDDDTLESCANHKIGFAVAMREQFIINDNAKIKNNLENLLNHSVSIYIVLGDTDDFYLSTDNALDFVDIYKTIRSFLILNDLYYKYDNLKGFLVDAEIPKNYFSDMENKDMYGRGNYVVNQLPSDDTLKKIQEGLKDIIDITHVDNKDFGIIKPLTTFDSLDNDNDYNKLSNTIYSLDLPWDLSISMNYRTQRVPTLADHIIRNSDEYDYTNDYKPAYLEKSQLERNLVPLSTFYQLTAYDLYYSEVGIPKDHRYIFIGVFSSEFKETSYIQEKEWKRDLDVCRNFGSKKVFFYYWSGFIKYYDLKDLIYYKEHKSVWVLWIPNYMITRESYSSLSLIIADKLLFI